MFVCVCVCVCVGVCVCVYVCCAGCPRVSGLGFRVQGLGFRGLDVIRGRRLASRGKVRGWGASDEGFLKV